MKRILCSLPLITALLAAGADFPAARTTRIAFLSDTHITLRTNEAGMLYRRHLDQAIAQVNEAKVDLVLIAGDLTDSGQPEQFDLFNQQVRRFTAPVLFIPGNHDVGMAADGNSKASINSERVNLATSKVGPGWFARERVGVRVIGINSCLFDSGLDEENDQWKFLEQELSKTPSTPTLVLEHYPPFLKTVDEPIKGTWNVRPDLRRRLLLLFKKGRVSAVLSGHLHYPIVNQHEGILFLGNTAIAFGLPKDQQDVGWMLLTVSHDGQVTHKFQKVE